MNLFQILNDGSAYLVTISTIGCKHPEIKIFDSLYCTLSPALKHQIAVLLATKEQKILWMYKCKQEGCDCSLFAIEFATSLCHGHSPGKFHFDQLSCFQRGHLKCSPLTEIGRAKTRLRQWGQYLCTYCSCRMPELPGGGGGRGLRVPIVKTAFVLAFV